MYGVGRTKEGEAGAPCSAAAGVELSCGEKERGVSGVFGEKSDAFFPCIGYSCSNGIEGTGCGLVGRGGGV